jgi:hypothetical protein
MSADDAYQEWLKTPKEPDYSAFLDGYEAGIRAAADSFGAEDSGRVESCLRQHILKLLEKS